MSYLFRATPPEAIKDIAADFDRETNHIAYRLLDLDGDNDAYNENIIELLRAPLRLGGFGITSAAASSHAAYLSSVASATAIAALHRHARADQPLPDDSIYYTLNSMSASQPSSVLLRHALMTYLHQPPPSSLIIIQLSPVLPSLVYNPL